MLEMKTPDVMDLEQDNEIEIFELEDAWLSDAAGGDVIINASGCTQNTRCRPEV